MKNRLHRYFFLFTCYLLLITCYLHAQFTIIPSVTNVTCPGGNDGTASVSVSGGAPPYTYQWSEGQTVSSITGLYAGNYTLTITDNMGIDSTVIIPVQQPSPISDNADIRQPFCIGNGHILLLPTGGTSPFAFLWNIGNTGAGIFQIGAGDYSVVITDANNCTAGFSYPLTETECFVTPDPYFTPNDDGTNDTWQISNSQFFTNAKVIVFDRWGTRVWEHKGLYEPWDGRSYLGIPVPDAVYYYFFYQDKEDKQKQAKAGSITILR